jgi:hypothetical protein
LAKLGKSHSTPVGPHVNDLPPFFPNKVTYWGDQEFNTGISSRSPHLWPCTPFSSIIVETHQSLRTPSSSQYSAGTRASEEGSVSLNHSSHKQPRRGKMPAKITSAVVIQERGREKGQLCVGQKRAWEWGTDLRAR